MRQVAKHFFPPDNLSATPFKISVLSHGIICELMHLHLALRACLRLSHSQADREGVEEGDNKETTRKLEANESSLFGNTFILTVPVVMACITWLYHGNKPPTLFRGVIGQIRRKTLK